MKPFTSILTAVTAAGNEVKDKSNISMEAFAATSPFLTEEEIASDGNELCRCRVSLIVRKNSGDCPIRITVRHMALDISQTLRLRDFGVEVSKFEAESNQTSVWNSGGTTTEEAANTITSIMLQIDPSISDEEVVVSSVDIRVEGNEYVVNRTRYLPDGTVTTAERRRPRKI